jgi:uncharacterized protein
MGPPGLMGFDVQEPVTREDRDVSRPTALVTGASSGIGRELARVFAEHDHDLVITARREDALQALARSLQPLCRVNVVPLDLARRKGPRRLLDALDDAELEIDVLVNNAGVAASGQFQEMPARAVRTMLRLNMEALTELTWALVPGMIERGYGRILNVASVSAFHAVPGLSLYSASKAYVLALTEGLAEDLRGTGVTATALCPGLTRTGMVDDIAPAALPDVLLADPRDVAREGYRACMAGEAVRVPGIVNQLMVGWLQHQPRSLVRYFSGMFARSTFLSGGGEGQGRRSGDGD